TPPMPVSAGAPSLDIRGRILLAEDNPISRDLVQLMLEDSQCEVVAEENGRQAVERLVEEPFDLVLMDCHMPEMDGYEATRRIRQSTDPLRARVPILALTASALESDRRRCEAVGMNEVLSKPISQQDLVRALDRWLGRARGASAPRPMP
ncbi:MAG: response regulator, partial [Acidobacteriota bacterium]